MSSNPTPDVLILCQDLFFTSQLTGSVQRAGLTPRTCLSQNSCDRALAELAGNVRWIVIDLEQPNLDLPRLRTTAGADCRLLAFGPHVHAEQLQSARAAGCDLVLTRGQISAELETILRSGTE